MTGRTLFGARRPKGQELEEHYFGAIRPTVNEFMKELDTSCGSSGARQDQAQRGCPRAARARAHLRRHRQRAIDQNLLTMEKMKLVATHHGLVCLQHEKPFEGVNGSGKHNNWSISATARTCSTRRHPEDNLQFLVFLSGVIAAVDDYQDLLRA